MQGQENMLLDFESAQEIETWRVINDGVMGGLSDSEVQYDTKGRLVFRGNVSLENNGGFASTRTLPRTFGLGGFDGVLLRVRGDGKTYQLRLKTDDRFDGVSYRFDFQTDPDAWDEIIVPFADMIPVFRGRVLEGVKPVQPESIRQLGFLISKKQAGSFQLEVDWIKAYKK